MVKTVQSRGTTGGMNFRRLKYRNSGQGSPFLVLLGVGSAIAIVYGWSIRSERYLTAESGWGYALGITGSLMMLALLFYPLRKRIRWLRGAGGVVWWFKAHMALGMASPVLILFHANFKTGSFNSTAALFSMLTVAGSGFVGRFFYRKIHIGLSQRKARIADVLDDAAKLSNQFRIAIADNPEILARMNEFESRMLVDYPRLHQSLAILGLSNFRAAVNRYRLNRIAKVLVNGHAKRHRWTGRQRKACLADVRRLLARYVEAVKRAAQFSVYERLFAWWHMLHLPLFFFLVLSVIGHVLAVHMY